MKYNRERALQLLRMSCGNPCAEFREGQEEAIRHLVEGGGRMLVVQKTGWGKSSVYFIATKLLREAGHGPSLLISPLLALMRNQVADALQMGVVAETINSSNSHSWSAIASNIEAGKTDILLISPERLANEKFRDGVFASIASDTPLLIIDEAHCISDWGHDFRPHYRQIERIIRSLPENVRVLATTATANQRVMADLTAVLGPNLEISRGDLSRHSLTLQTITLPTYAQRLAWVAEQLGKLSGNGIIYTLTTRDAEDVAAWLRIKGFAAEAYSGSTGPARERLEQALLANEVKALVATSALGMGFNKPDLSFVIHFQAPGSVVAYYQQVGRAGRALDDAYGVMLGGDGDDSINEWFVQSAFPSRDEASLILGLLAECENGMTSDELLEAANIKPARLEKTVELLALESPAPLFEEGGRLYRTAADVSDAFWARATRLTELRMSECDQMRAYQKLPFGTHMAFLVSALDGDASTVRAPNLPPLSDATNPDLVAEATAYVLENRQVIEPKWQWPKGGLPKYGISARLGPRDIGKNLQASPGRVLSDWGDAGWSALIRRGKYEAGEFSDELVAASADVISSWGGRPPLEWVTCVPSIRHPRLVPSFAKRLAAKLGLPFIPLIEKTDNRPPQKSMNNKLLQVKNVDGSFRLNGNVSAGPVLLVDDMVDSRWTMTVCAWLLRSAGSGEVFPFALARTGRG